MKKTLPFLILLLALVFGGCSRDAGEYLERGRALAAQGDHVRASLEFRKAIQQDEGLGEAYLALGLSELEQDNGAEGMAALQRAVELMPDSAEAKARLADLALAIYQANPGNQPMYDLLAKLADQLFAQDPESFDGLRIRGDLELFSGQPNEAIEYFERANAVRPNEKYLMLPYVEALFKAGQAEEAQRLADEYIAHDPSGPEMYDLLYLYYASSQRPEDALAVLQSRARNNPNSADARISLATHHARIGDEAAARAVIGEITSDHSRFDDGLLKAGAFLMLLGDREGAAGAYQQGLEADPEQRSEYLRRMATVRLAQNRREEGRKLIDQSLEADPGNSAARFTLANLLLLEGGEESVARAIVEFEGIIKDKPADALLRLNLSKAYLAANETDKARAMLAEAARLNPRDVESRLLLTGLTLELNMPAEALRHAEEALVLAPDNPGVRMARAQALAATQRYEEASSELDRLARRFPDSREVQVQQGLIAIQQGRLEEAEQILSGLVEGSADDLRALAGLTDIYSAQNQLDQAFSIVDARLGAEPDSAPLRSLRAVTAMRAGRLETAVADYERLARDNPKSVQALISLGNAYGRQGRLQEGLRLCEEARGLAPQSLGAKLCIALTLHQLGRPEEAVAAYRHILAQSPTNPIVANNLAYLLAKSGQDLEEATEMAQALVERQPSYADAHDTLGWVYLQRGMADSALQVFQKLVRDNPKHPSYQHHLGAALAAKKEFAGARAALETALQCSPAPEEEAEIRRLIQTLGG